MRILSIGRPLAHPSIDNASVFSAPAWSDYEAIVIDPGGVFAQIAEAAAGAGDHRTLSELPVVNGDPAGADAISIAEVLRRRRDETRQALERGALIVVFAYPQATLPQVLGFTGVDRYWFLPAPPGLGWAPPHLRWGEGTTVAVADHAHAFARYVDALHGNLRYRAVFDERAPGFAQAARMIARSGGGAPVGIDCSVLGGTVVVLPAPATLGGNGALAQGQAIEEAVRERLGRPDPYERPPSWLDDIELPGLAPLATAAANARELAGRAEERARAAEAERDDLARLRDVLWRQGAHSLLPAALRCAELLGYRTWPTDPAPTLHADDGDVLLEVEGSDSAVGMAPHYRLRARLDAILAAEGRHARGLVVVNGFRLHPPDRRETQYVDALRVGAEATRYALVTTSDLFEAARAALAGGDIGGLAQLRRRLRETDGVVHLQSEGGEVE